MSVVRSAAVVAAGLVLLAGCSSSQPPAEAMGTVTLFQDVEGLLRASEGTNKRPPARLADLNRHQSMFSRGYDAVKSGDVVVLWGARMQGEGEVGKNEAVVAYEKAVPTEGGYVLLSAGTIKKMTAAEFNAAPK